MLNNRASVQYSAAEASLFYPVRLDVALRHSPRLVTGKLLSILAETVCIRFSVAGAGHSGDDRTIELDHTIAFSTHTRLTGAYHMVHSVGILVHASVLR